MEIHLQKQAIAEIEKERKSFLDENYDIIIQELKQNDTIDLQIRHEGTFFDVNLWILDIMLKTIARGDG